MPSPRQVRLAALRAEIASMEPSPTPGEVLAFGYARLDGCLPGGGLPLGRWHEFTGEGLDLETAAVSASFVARLVAGMAAKPGMLGELVWVLRRDDLYAPGLASLGFPAERLIQVCARDDDEALAVLEDALRTPGVVAAFGEAGEVSLTAGRRLQLACEQGGATGFILRRRPFGGARVSEPGSAAATRWTIAPAPSEPLAGSAPKGALGLGPPRWRVVLERCRGGRTGAWILEAREEDDASHPFRLVADLADRDVATQTPLRLAG
ncbi:MAG TPA: protein imuA [Caulobacteraceae bacterium]|nr:protein imuA [Caulobacteraceae bacterium]